MRKGGMLQAVIFGFCGAEITDKGLIFHQTLLPSHWKSVILKGYGPNKETIKIMEK